MTYYEQAIQQGVTEEGLEVLRLLAEEANYTGEPDNVFDIFNYALRSGPWDYQDDHLPIVAAINMAGKNDVQAILALREAWGLPALV